jgi:hypothetical protein
VNYWQINADNLSKSRAGVAAVPQPWIVAGRMILVADAHRDDGKRFVVGVNEKLTAFMELESAVRGPP